MASLVRVIIASRVRLYRESLALLPGSRTGVEVVGWARGPDDALAGVEETEPDVLLLDLTMEGDSEQVRRLVQQVRVPVVILGVEDYDADNPGMGGVLGRRLAPLAHGLGAKCPRLQLGTAARP